MRDIQFEGKQFSFPDDASDDEIGSALNSTQATTWWKTFKAVPGTALGGAQKGLGGSLQGAGETDYLTGMGYPAADLIASKTGESSEQVQDKLRQGRVENDLSKTGAGMAESGKINEDEAHPGNMSFWQRSFLNGVSSAAQQVPGMTASILTKNPAPAIGAAVVTQGGQSYSESREAGAGPERSAGHAALDATAEGLFELLPTKFLVDNLGKPVLKLIFGTLVREVPTEVLTTAVQSANARLRDQDLKGQPWSWKDYGQDLLDTVGATMVAAPLMAGGAKGIDLAVRAGQKKPSSSLDTAGDNPALKPGESVSDIAQGVDVGSPKVVDQPTVPLDSKQKADIDALIASIDSELLDDKAVADAQAVLAKHEELRKAPATAENETAWMGLAAAPTGEQDIGEPQLGATAKQAANASAYVNPNQGDRLDRTFLYGPEGSVGLTPRQVTMQPATYTLGEPSADRSADYLKAVNDTVEQWRQEYMPGSTFIISNEGLFNNAALGWHYSLGQNQHLIVPAVLRSPSKGLGSFNMNTQASAFYNLTHEFGHALILDRFYTEMKPDLAQAVKEASEVGVVPDAMILSLPAPQQAVVAEYNALKAGVMSGKLSAQNFVDKWFSPGKLGQKTLLEKLGVAPTDNALAVVKAIVRQATKRSNINDDSKVKALRQRLTQDFLSLDEYLAEQTARHAYKSKMDQGTPLGKFFSQALASLRKFFTGLKKSGTIAPGTAFTDWMEGLAKSDRDLNKGERAVKAKKSGRKPAPKAETAPATKTKKKAVAKPKVVTVQHNIETDTEEGKKKKAASLIATLIRNKVVEAGDPQVKELRDLAKQQDWPEFLDTYSKLAGKSVKFELNAEEQANTDLAVLRDQMNVLRAGIPEENLDAGTMAEAQRLWKEKQFRSPYFKAWFGDWENDSPSSSKIRRGAIVPTPAGNRAEIDTGETTLKLGSFGGEPLVVYHGTTFSRGETTTDENAFQRFDRGDIGFHFGTVRAAHQRIGMYSQGEPGFTQQYAAEGSFVMPVVLNIRNPIILNADLGDWAAPRPIINELVNQGYFTTDEGMAAKDAIANFGIQKPGTWETGTHVYNQQYQALEPLRAAIVAKGYDGIIYRNSAEDAGSWSFIAFHPNQIKSLLGSRTFSRSDNLHFELDLDASQPSGLGLRKMWDGLKNFTDDFPRMRRITRWVNNAVYSVVELQQLAHLNPDVSELQFMSEKNGEYNRYKASLQAQADSVLSEWNSLGKESWNKLNKFLLAEAEGKQLWWDLAKTTVNRDGRPVVWYEYTPNATTAQKAQEFGLDENLADMATDIKNVLLSQVNEAEQALLNLLGKRYAAASPQVLTAAFIPVKRHIHEIRKQAFFPQGRFGNRMLIVEKQKADGIGWEIVWKEHFENSVDWEKAWKAAEARKGPDERVRKESVSDQTYVMMALPADFVDMAASELGLSDEQLEVLMSVLQPVKRDRILSAYDQQRLGIKGYSTDAMRSFANFTWHNSNLLAKLIYRADFNLGIRGVGIKLREAKYSNDPASLELVDRLEHIKSYMEKARDYVMAPPNEAQQLRALVSIAYLGLNVKTAVLNLYGLITTWSDITSKLGQVEGNKLFLKASKEAFSSIKLTNLNERREGSYLPADKQKALDQALEQGVLSQSYAYHLAGMANAGNLYRLPARQLLGRVFQHAIDASMYIFRLTELSTRRASFLAEFEQARKQPNLSFEEAYREAVDRTNKLQNDYSLGNRVPFMRGFKLDKGNPLGKIVEPIVPLATVFMSFAQHMAFHSYGGYEIGERRMAKELGETPRSVFGGYTMKLWLVTLLIAGYEGLPGMENLLDLIEAAWRKWGGQKPIRQELREMVQTLEIDPQFASRGFGHNIAGYDISRSVGFGRIVPGTDSFAKSGQKNSLMDTTGNIVFDLLGPTGGFLKFGLEALGSDKSKAESFQHLPGGAGNIYTAYYWSQHGVRAPTGARITHDLETGQLRDLTADEILGKALGFNPTVVSQNREIRFQQYDRKVYWQTRRQILMDDVWKARLEKDREAESDAKKTIVEYNTGIPAEYRAMKITGTDIARSMQSRQKIMRADEMQTTTSRRYRPLYEDVRQSYDQP